MSVLSIVVGVLIVWFAVSPTAVLIGRSIRLADKRSPAPSTGEVGEAPARRGAHLRLVP